MNKRGVGLDSEPITVNTDQNSKSFYINHLDQVEVYGKRNGSFAVVYSYP